MSMQNKSVLAVIGGGRWGQVILSILASISIPFDYVVIVSKFNEEDIHSKLKEWEKSSATCFEVVPSIEDLFAQYSVTAAIVVNAAQQHFDTALQLINQGIHVLIEKPIVLLTEQMNILIAKAHEKKVCILPGLCYRFSSYLDNFAKIIPTKGTPSSFAIHWHDMSHEIRYGQLKKHDTTIDVAQDVMPHIWSILSKIFCQPIVDIRALAYEMTEDYAAFQVSLSDITGHVILKRNAPFRERSICVEFNKNKFLKIDFSAEPGNIFWEANSFPADKDWQQKPSPLTQQLNYFFSYLKTGAFTQEEIDACISSVTWSKSASMLLQKTKINFMHDIEPSDLH